MLCALSSQLWSAGLNATTNNRKLLKTIRCNVYYLKNPSCGSVFYITAATLTFTLQSISWKRYRWYFHFARPFNIWVVLSAMARANQFAITQPPARSVAETVDRAPQSRTFRNERALGEIRNTCFETRRALPSNDSFSFVGLLVYGCFFYFLEN